jgi:hypothetical protein
MEVLIHSSLLFTLVPHNTNDGINSAMKKQFDADWIEKENDGLGEDGILRHTWKFNDAAKLSLFMLKHGKCILKIN